MEGLPPGDPVPVVHCAPSYARCRMGFSMRPFRRIEPRSRIPPAGFPCFPCIAACTFPAHRVGEVISFRLSKVVEGGTWVAGRRAKARPHWARGTALRVQLMRELLPWCWMLSAL